MLVFFQPNYIDFLLNAKIDEVDEEEADREYTLPPGVAARVADLAVGAGEKKEGEAQPEADEKEDSDEDDVISAEEVDELLKEAEAELPADLLAQKQTDVDALVKDVAKLSVEPSEEVAAQA